MDVAKILNLLITEICSKMNFNLMKFYYLENARLALILLLFEKLTALSKIKFQ